MKNRTHRVVGAAVALAAVQPKTTAECAIALAAGVMGGAMSDIDLLWKRSGAEVGKSALRSGLVLVCLIALDFLAKAGVTTSLAGCIGPYWLEGLALLLLLMLAGFCSEHRSFTHSLLGMTLFTAAVHLLAPGHALGFLAGFASHLALDLLNRAPLKLCYPFRKGSSLRLFRADGTADRVLWGLGWTATAWQLVDMLL